MATEPQGKKVTCLGQIVILLFIAGCIGGAYWLFTKDSGEKADQNAPNTATSSSSSPSANQSTPSQPSGPKTTIGIAYGTEKERWLEWAVEEFAKTDAGKKIEIDLIPMGSVEGGQAVLAEDERIHVWSPASALYKDVVVQEWQLKHNAPPFIREEALALSPMVFVFWKERYEAFVAKYQEVTFQTIQQALTEPGGWDAIAGKLQWGLFKFGHTNPNESNSGLMTLVLMAYNYAGVTQGLTMKNILDAGFQNFMISIEKAVSGLENSTGTMMKQMVLRGPSTYDALCVYENVAIDYLKNAEGRYGSLMVAYPKQNMWNDNPYYILDAPWSSEQQKEAADIFLDFLLTEPIQARSLVHGFRPADPAVPIKGKDSPFEKYQANGFRIDLTGMCEPPKADVLTNLLAAWQRSIGR